MDNIRSRKAVAEGLWDWGFLNDCFPGKQRLSDMDGWIERRGWFLVIEGKKTGTVDMSAGQMRGLVTLSKLEEFVVIVVEGSVPNAIEYITVLGRTNRFQATEKELKCLCKQWSNYVENNQYPYREHQLFVPLNFARMVEGMAEKSGDPPENSPW